MMVVVATGAPSEETSSMPLLLMIAAFAIRSDTGVTSPSAFARAREHRSAWTPMPHVVVSLAAPLNRGDVGARK